MKTGRNAVRLILFALALFGMMIGRSQAQAPYTDSARYKLSDFILKAEVEGVVVEFPALLTFIPSVISEPNRDTYKLQVILEVTMNDIVRAVQVIADRKLPKDNCARFDGPNRVVNMNGPRMSIEGEHTFRLYVTGSYEEWACARPISDSFRCESYRDDFGNTWPSTNCRTVRGEPVGGQSVLAGHGSDKIQVNGIAYCERVPG